MESDLSLPKHILWVLLLAVKDPTPPHGASKVGPWMERRGCEGGVTLRAPRPRGRQAQEAPLCPEPTGSSSAQQKAVSLRGQTRQLACAGGELSATGPGPAQAPPSQPRWAGVPQTQSSGGHCTRKHGLALLNHPYPHVPAPLDKSRRSDLSLEG